jgi:hypothetical protein
MSTAQQVWELSRLFLAEQDGIIMVLKVYMDESGIHDNSPVVTVAAYIGRPRDWQNWTKRWNTAKRPIKVYHATDAQALHGEFEGWSEPGRDEVVKRILPVIAEANLPGMVIGIQMDEFRKAFSGRPELIEMFGTPYGACFQWLIQSLMYARSKFGSIERYAFVHECNDYQREALEAFNYVKKYCNPQNSPTSISFGTKADYPPLQAADILAYEGNRRMRDPDRPERRPWKILNPDRRIVAAHYGRQNMPDLIGRLEKIRDGKMNEIDLDAGWKRFLTSAQVA